MVAHHYSRIEEIVNMPGATGVGKRTLIGRDHGAPSFYLRRFTVSPGGSTPRHSHAWEHEIYVLAGAGTVFVDGEETGLAEDMAVFIPCESLHQIKAGEDGLVFLCMIPAVDEG